MDCPFCHQKLPGRTCPHCQAEVPEESVFCLRCGGLIQPPAAAAEPAEGGQDDPFADRILCSDGACIGVIGPDGRCKECGKPYRPEGQ